MIFFQSSVKVSSGDFTDKTFHEKVTKIAVSVFVGMLLLWSLPRIGHAQITWTDGSSATRSVAENTPAGTNIGAPVSATFTGEGDSILTYSLGGTDAGSFRIVSGTGQLQTEAALDYETKNSYTVQVSASNGSVSASITVTITVTDEAEVTEIPTPDPPPPEPQRLTQTPRPEPTPETTPEPTAKKVLITRQSQCGLGWAPKSEFPRRPDPPKVMIYALEFEFVNGTYTCSAIEIRTGDATLSHLDGWKLSLSTLYNPVGLPITLTQENSQMTDQMLRLTPESLGQHTFLCGTLFLSGQPLPSLRYELKNENNLLIDRAYSCYLYGQSAVAPAGGISPRRISGQALLAMDSPRLERYITEPTGIFRRYIDFEAFGWDRVVLSDWLLAASDASDIRGGNAPSSPYTQLTTSWGALKLRKTDRRQKGTQ